MNFNQKTIPNIKISETLGTENQIVTIGSCFADNIAGMLLSRKFNVISNPFGILYHPVPVLKVLEDSIQSATASEKEFVHFDGLWRWWYGHGSMAEARLPVLQDKITSLKNVVRKAFSSDHPFLIVTFGTSYLYERKEDNAPVANCHKMPASLFRRRFTPYGEFTGSWEKIIRWLVTQNPGLQIIFTVSPVRHIKDGLHENNLSKANLLLFVDHLLSAFPRNTSYFPAYELMLDTLRDYQYYKEDLIHPNEKAVEFIGEQFAQAYFDSASKDWVRKLAPVQNELNHRPLHPESESFRKFVPALERKLSEIMSCKPDKDWRIETDRLKKLQSLLPG